MKMFPSLLLSLLFLSGPLSVAVRAEVVSTNAQAKVRFKGDSTLHAFEGSGMTGPFALTIHPSGSTHRRQWSAAARLKVRAMSTENRKRDQNMFEMFASETFPEILAEVKDAAISLEDTAKVQVAVTIRDRHRLVEASVSEWREEPGHIEFALTFPVSLREFGLDPPSVLGLIRIADRVDVTCRVLAPLSAARNSERR